MLTVLLKQLRTSKNLSQTDVARHLSITRQAYNHYETGKRVPPLETIHQLSKYYGVTTDYLLGRDAEIKKDPGIVSDAEIDEGAMLLRSLPENLQEEAMRYLRFLVAEEKKQAGEDK